jgi:NosR/NirI family transcriptional regulator, nitrous oxide reductase regulator
LSTLILRLYVVAFILFMVMEAAIPCQAADSRLAEFAGQVPVGELVPGADHYGPAEGSPPVMKT